ncbi:alanine and glycine-rich protein-like [Passer montanus]|uniref:alanine and glycine-rich protein-like n=1 Tax=Passer montanus TaxID=9160 RepID=UPI00195F8DAE|nr:alanine and glycine-rich protein-like [Passer montanus]
MTRPRLLVRSGGRAGRHPELLQRLANASPPRGRRTCRRSGAAGAGGTRHGHRGSVTAASSLSSAEPQPEPAGGCGSRRAPQSPAELAEAAAVSGAGAGAAPGRGQVGGGRCERGGGGGSPGPAIKREGAGGARCGSARRNVPGGAGGRLSRRGSGRLCPAVSRLPRPPSLPQESRHRDARLPRAAQRWRGGAAATSCGTGPAGAGGSVEAKNKNWQKLCSVYENVKSVLMTKHRNLENHR